MTIYIDLQGCLEMETKSTVKVAIPQQPYTKEFKDQLVKIYNSGGVGKPRRNVPEVIR